MQLPSLTTLIPSPRDLAIGFVAGGLLAGVGTGMVVHKMGLADLNALKLADSRATTTAVARAAAQNHAIDTQNTTAAVRYVEAKAQVIHDTQVITQEIPHYVTQVQVVRSGCVGVGLVQLLNAASRGQEPASLDATAPGPPDACTTLTLADVAAYVNDAFGVARGNAGQLDALIAAVKANDAVATEKAP